MDWNCLATEERLSDFLDGALSIEESAAFSAHAGACANCARTLAQVGGLVRQMHQAEPIEPPAQLVENILVATLGVRRGKHGPRWWNSWLPAIWEPRFAMGVVTVAASFLIVIHAFGAAPRNTTPAYASLNPIAVLRTVNRQSYLTYARGAKFVNDLRLVYQIESWLQPSAEPVEPVAPEPEGQPSSPGPKSERQLQKAPRTGGGIVPNDGSLASLFDAAFPGQSPDKSPNGSPYESGDRSTRRLP